jgi:hypothetical protein
MGGMGGMKLFGMEREWTGSTGSTGSTGVDGIDGIDGIDGTAELPRSARVNPRLGRHQ